jgi:hypothetical protein
MIFSVMVAGIKKGWSLYFSNKKGEKKALIMKSS